MRGGLGKPFPPRSKEALFAELVDQPLGAFRGGCERTHELGALQLLGAAGVQAVRCYDA